MESGKKPLFTMGSASAKVKEAPPWPTSNLIPRLRASSMKGAGLPSGVSSGRGHAKDVGADVSRAQDARDHLLIGLVVEPAEIDHDRQMVALACLDGLLHGDEVGLLPVRSLDADDDVAVLLDRLRKRIEVHVVFVLLGGIVDIGHARSNNVEEGEDAGRGIVNDAATELGKVAPTKEPASATVVTPFGMAMTSAGTERSPVAPRVVAKSGEDVHVDVDQPGREIEPEMSTDCLAALAGIVGSMAAILPSRTATSSFAATLFFGSGPGHCEEPDRTAARARR